jgi:hypothetical protein
VDDTNRQVAVEAYPRYLRAVIMRDRAGDTVVRYPLVDTNVYRASRLIGYRSCFVIRRSQFQTSARRLAILTDYEDVSLSLSEADVCMVPEIRSQSLSFISFLIPYSPVFFIWLGGT